jgi:predicted MFS family arabinose efflux permease
MSQAIVSPTVRRISPATALLLITAAVLTISTGLRQSLGLFLPPMATIGISVSAFSFAVALQSLVWGFGQPFIGMLADRYGTRPVLAATALVYAAGLAVMALTGGVLGLDVGGGVLIGLGVAGTGLGVVMGAVSRAVPPERRSQAVGTVAAAGSLGTLVLAPLGQYLIDIYGWRNALLGFAMIAAVMAPLALAMARGGRGEEAVSAEDEDGRTLGEVLRAAARHKGYLAMTAAFFACGFQLMFITVHLPSYLAFCGMPAALGASALGVIGLCNTVGTYAIGLLGARYSQKRLLALVYLLRTLAIIAFLVLPISPTTTLIFAAAMGFLWLSVAPLVSGLVGRLFGLKHFSTLYGFVFLSHQIGSFCGVLLGGIAFDLTGSYGTAWAGLIGIGLLAFALQWRMDDRRVESRGMRGAAAIRQVAGI